MTSKDTRYRHIDALFSDAVDWQLIETHWPDLLQVVLSIKAGTISSAQLLRRLGSYSRRNRLYQAFRELGRVVRTVFLLEYLSDAQLREHITATTNKVEAYNGFAKWLNFGGEGVIDTLDPVEQEKHLKYNHLIANAAAIQNVIDLTRAVRLLQADGHIILRDDLAQLSPYQPDDSSDSATTRCRSAHLSRSTANFWCRSRSASRPRSSSPEATRYFLFSAVCRHKAILDEQHLRSVLTEFVQY